LAYNESEPFTDDRYKERQAGITDREITREFKPAMSSDNDKEAKQREIESELGLVPADDTTPEHDKSYLAAVDHIKQLYRKNRHEAALIEIDDLLKLYPSDSKIYAMRGTLLHRIGKLDLALQSWNQALKLEPNNLSLKRFIERKQQKRSLASP
ncbi:MAG: hypothetical protein HY072_05100, partial [Deltaproteobacteria bacterium]|nr:hypothetical protein [Deltaproteobacteria bacterium]